MLVHNLTQIINILFMPHLSTREEDGEGFLNLGSVLHGLPALNGWPLPSIGSFN